MTFESKFRFFSGWLRVLRRQLLLPRHVKGVLHDNILWWLIILLCAILNIRHLVLGVFPLIISEKDAQDSIRVYITPISFQAHPGSSLRVRIAFLLLLQPMLAKAVE